MLDKNSFLWQLTVAEYESILDQKLSALFNNNLSPQSNKKFEYGLKGLAKILGCSKSTAWKIKESGDLKGAISQKGNLIIIEVELALKLFRERGNGKKT